MIRSREQFPEIRYHKKIPKSFFIRFYYSAKGKINEMDDPQLTLHVQSGNKWRLSNMEEATIWMREIDADNVETKQERKSTKVNEQILSMKTNNHIIKFMVILGLFAVLMSGCGPAANQTSNTANTTNAAANSAPANTATNTSVNSNTANSNANTESSNSSPVAAAKPDNCDGPADNEVIIYEDIFSDNGGGKCVKLKVGEYKNAAAMGFANDSMSSIKVGVNVRATVCDNENFTAPCEEFDKTDYDLMDNPTIKNDTVSSIKVVEVKAEAKPEAVKALSNGLAGEWTDGRELLKFTDDKLVATYVKQDKPYNTSPYKVIDGKTVEFKFENGTAAKAIMTFEDNGNTLVWYRPDNGITFKMKRVNPK